MRSKVEQRTAYLQQEDRTPTVALGVEIALARANLLYKLEAAGIVPTVVNPNPFPPLEYMAEHERWWQEHQEAQIAFYSALEERQRTLHRLYVGSQLARVISGSHE
jgi:hypothetical protein